MRVRLNEMQNKSFLDASTHVYKRCVRWLVGPVLLFWFQFCKPSMITRTHRCPLTGLVFFFSSLPGHSTQMPGNFKLLWQDAWMQALDIQLELKPLLGRLVTYLYMALILILPASLFISDNNFKFSNMQIRDQIGSRYCFFCSILCNKQLRKECAIFLDEAYLVLNKSDQYRAPFRSENQKFSNTKC